MLTIPKLMTPFQIDLGIIHHHPSSRATSAMAQQGNPNHTF
jgi:hypothetical protein